MGKTCGREDKITLKLQTSTNSTEPKKGPLAEYEAFGIVNGMSVGNVDYKLNDSCFLSQQFTVGLLSFTFLKLFIIDLFALLN